MARLSRNFYMGNTVEIAKKLLGTCLVRILDGEALVCRITETEAYIGRCDKACHAYNYRKTPRTSILFGSPGHAYVYFIYGMYHCLNFVTEPEGEPAAVLIRAVEPIAGNETIRRLRFGTNTEHLTAYQRKNFMNGPGKLCKGLSLTTLENGMDLTGDTLFVCEYPTDIGLASPLPSRERICAGPRIGVDYAEEARDFPWRFWLETEV
ncbi:DNA-3-methyladenine glycosylase [Oscillibacter sp. PC13]|uniref:DNA-3-methyladenine glycosylase n=1 Tax=Oscillibacter sp. PC13 TaxID=1855299 RepID=UPI0008E2C863|nr:DNA-3-methyladenine glycosylase [Oscillibacter sp. PC13]SFP10469.1 DNA-3-methyladenine glycosylase [Oscillibacter sp. PC13]